MDMAEQGITRRRFLDRAWKILGLAAALEFLYVAVAFLWPRPGKENRRTFIEAGTVAEFTPASVTAFAASRFYLVRLQDGGFLALSSACTHLGCSVPWNEKQRKFLCPCHASVFDITGQVLSPPAPRALDLHPVKIEGGIVKVDTGTKIRRRQFETRQVTYL